MVFFENWDKRKFFELHRNHVVFWKKLIQWSAKQHLIQSHFTGNIGPSLVLKWGCWKWELFVSSLTRNVFHLRNVKLWHLSIWTVNCKTERLCQQHNNQILIKNELTVSKRIAKYMGLLGYKNRLGVNPTQFVLFAGTCPLRNTVIKVNYLFSIFANSTFNNLSTDVVFRGSPFTLTAQKLANMRSAVRPQVMSLTEIAFYMILKSHTFD